MFGERRFVAKSPKYLIGKPEAFIGGACAVNQVDTAYSLASAKREKKVDVALVHDLTPALKDKQLYAISFKMHQEGFKAFPSCTLLLVADEERGDDYCRVQRIAANCFYGLSSGSVVHLAQRWIRAAC